MEDVLIVKVSVTSLLDYLQDSDVEHKVLPACTDTRIS